MQNEIQLLSFLVSFIFGVLFAFLNELNNKFIFKQKPHFKVIITFLFILNLSLLYLMLIYNINGGIIHIYFFIFILLGYLISFRKIKNVLKYVKHLSKKLKRVKKDSTTWYNVEKNRRWEMWRRFQRKLKEECSSHLPFWLL